jgi:hypothetical protein
MQLLNKSVSAGSKNLPNLLESEEMGAAMHESDRPIGSSLGGKYSTLEVQNWWRNCIQSDTVSDMEDGLE